MQCDHPSKQGNGPIGCLEGWLFRTAHRAPQDLPGPRPAANILATRNPPS